MTREVATYLKYANLQMASEALLDRIPQVGLVKALTDGNNRSSKFTQIQADQFIADGWTVVEHKSNTATGFSGTLFKNNSTGELVLSFRSTEFADDAARDNQATNGMEIRPFGWAFGQISDMQSWVDSLLDGNKLNLSQTLTVTGYSLGGHLATAFELLYPNAATSIYTFNGAGVGRIESRNSLKQIIDAFDQRRGSGANAGLFTNAQVRDLYNAYKNVVSYSNGALTLDVIDAAVGQAKTLTTQLPPNSQGYGEALQLAKAVQRSRDIAFEALRVSGLPSGNGNDALGIALSNIEAVSLDYQLAVLKAGEKTSSYGDEDAVLKANGALPRTSEGRANIFDVYGAPPPSMVANSQRHLGAGTPIWIEDQPTLRGSVYQAIWDASSFATGVKLLTPEFSTNDFGDTHSLVLLVDSLSVQDTLAKLDPNVQAATVSAILEAASNAKAETGFVSNVGANNQGKADGDTLEKVVNALSKIFGVPGEPLIGKLEGNTWANPDDRAALHARLSAIQTKIKDLGLGGKFTLTAVSSAAANDAKTDFAAFLSLQALSPFMLTTSDTSAAAKLKQAHEALAQGWESDAQLTATQRADGLAKFSDQWYADRAAMLVAATQVNQLNIDGPLSIPGAQGMRFEDIASGKKIDIGLPDNVVEKRQTLFGGDKSDALTGKKLEDHLYGGAGADTLDGKGGNDHLEGGSGMDTYQFSASFGKDLVHDQDGLGFIQIDGKTLGTAKAAGKADLWVAELDGGQKVGLALYDTGSSTGKKLVIARAGSTADTVTINNFDLARARSEAGYLGIKLDSTPKVALRDTGGENPFKDSSFNPATLTGNATLQEHGGESFAVYLNRAAEEGDTITLGLTGLQDKFRVILGDSTVPAQGAVITLHEGQTQAVFALVQEGDVQADGQAQLSATYQGQGDAGTQQQTATSNAWGITLRDLPEAVRTIRGDQHGHLTPDGSGGMSYASGVDEQGRLWLEDGSIANGVTEAGFADVLGGYSGVAVQRDSISALGGNDALQGRFLEDFLDGGEGDDLVGGGPGADAIYGGGGNDVILSAAQLNVWPRRKPDDKPDIPVGAVVHQQGPTWARYTLNGATHILGGGTTDEVDSHFNWVPAGTGDLESAGDFADGGAGDDVMIAGLGADRLVGGLGRDTIFGHGGADVVEGGDDDDSLYGDGTVVTATADVGTSLYYESTTAESHGADFIDGGQGNDEINGGGSDDRLFGGAGADSIYGDDANGSLEAAFHGVDYINGEDGDDLLVGNGGDDELIGGNGNDEIQGDDGNIDGQFHGADVLDGADGDDLLFGGGGDDELTGGSGADQLVGDADELGGEFHGADSLDGGDGNDELYAQGGDDTLLGGGGNDYLEGDASELDGRFHGADLLDGEDGDDELFGHGGADTLLGGQGDDYLEGDGDKVASQFHGNDELDGGEGDDQMRGQGGNDTLLGGLGNDILDGDDGDDVLDGGAGRNILHGGAGNDSITVGADDGAWGGAGDDTYWVNGPGQVTDTEGRNTYYIAASASYTDANNVLQMPRLAIGPQDIVVFQGLDVTQGLGSANGVRLEYADLGGTQVPVLWGGTTAVLLSNGSLAGSIQIQGVGGEGVSLSDVVFASPQTVETDLDGADVLTGSGDDRVRLGGSGCSASTGDGQDSITVDGSAAKVHAGDGADLLWINGANAIVTPGGGDDQLWVGTAHTTVVLHGQDAQGSPVAQGHDTLVLKNAASVVLDMGENADLAGVKPVFSQDSNGQASLVLSMGGQESQADQTMTIRMDTPADALTLAGRITLKKGDQLVPMSTVASAGITLAGSPEDDQLVGTQGNDILQGGQGKDQLLGGAGNDTLDGGLGQDQLEGGAGDDTYLFAIGDDAGVTSAVTDAEGTNTLVLNGGDLKDMHLTGGASRWALRYSENDALQLSGNFHVRWGGSTYTMDEFVQVLDSTSNHAPTVTTPLSGITVRTGEAWRYTLPAGAFTDTDAGDVLTYSARLEDGSPLPGWLSFDAATRTLTGTPPVGSSGLRIAFTVTDTAGLSATQALALNLVAYPTPTLVGTAARDTLQGGAGVDVIDGGAGDDVLAGGAGNDVYLLQTGTGGLDTLVDNQGENVIWVNGVQAQGAFTRTAGMGGEIYYSADKTFQLRPTIQGAWRLSMKDEATGDYAAAANIKDWHSGQFGLSLGADNPAPERATLQLPNSTAHINFNAADAAMGVNLGGGTRSDSFSGSAFGDVITTGGGDSNYVNAGNGDDWVLGGSGKDYIRTGRNIAGVAPDADIAYGGAGTDVLMGGAGDDQLWGDNDDGTNDAAAADSGTQGDWLNGEWGNDLLVGSRHRDVLFGGSGEDVMKGGAGADLMLGDTLFTTYRRQEGSPYPETLPEVNPNMDVLPYEAGSVEAYVWSGNGNNIVLGNYQDNPVAIASGGIFNGSNWSSSSYDGEREYFLGGGELHLDYELLVKGGGRDVMDGGEGDDWMAGQIGDDVMHGGMGDDLMFGEEGQKIADADAGNDLMYGDEGNDEMFGGAKDDEMHGGDGNDRMYGQAGSDSIFGNAGDDYIDSGWVNIKLTSLISSSYREIIDGSPDMLDGGAGNDRLDSSSGNDTLYGGEGDDWLTGRAGDDYLEGGDGIDYLDGQEGLDYLYGGAGNDLYRFDVGDDAGVTSIATDSEGDNTVLLFTGHLKDMQLTGSGSDWTLRYSANDTVKLSGNFSIRWAGKNYTTTEFAQAIADATTTTTPPDPDPVNRAPAVAATLSDATARKGEAWTYLVPVATFADPDAGDTLVYSAMLADGSALPAWLSFDAATRTFSGTAPANVPAGPLNLAVTATDAGGLSASTGFTLAITAAANAAPVAGQPLQGASVDEDTAWTYTVPADAFTDPDAGDALVVTATLADGSALPAWLSFDAATRTFSGTPGNGDVTELAITLRATDPQGASAVQALQLQVRNVNDAPTVGAPLPSHQAKEGEALAFAVPAGAFADVDAGDSLSLQASLAGGALPAWLQFDAAKGTLTGTPPAGSAGELQVVITATDRTGATASQTLQLVVAPATAAPNSPPTVTAAPADATATENAAWTYTVPANTFTDPEGQALTYTVTLADGSALPNWLSFDAATRTLSGTPGSAAVGNLSLRVRATDPAGATASAVLALTIAPQPGGTGSNTDQVLQADDQNTPVVGGNGNDTITGSWASSTLSGGAGNDRLIATGGPQNVLDGGEGDDEITGGWGNDRLIGGEGNNTIRANGSSSIITAGSGHDTITGSWGDDHIDAGHGNNRIDAAGGKNTVIAGDGDDTITSGWGDDTIDAGNGNNTIDAGGGTNHITSGAGNDVVRADGTNTIATGAGNDHITTTWGADTIDAGAGDDLINAGGGNNTLRGGLGNDQFTSTDWSDDRYLFARGDGQDTVGDGGGQDILILEDVRSDQLWFTQVGNDLSVNVLGTQDSILVKDWYGSGGNGSTQFHLEQIKTSDGKTLLDSQVHNLVQAMSAFAPPVAGQTTLPAGYQSALAPVLAANWQ